MVTRSAVFLLLAVITAACSPAYVFRSAVEEARILWRRTPIETILAGPDLEPGRRTKLEMVLAVRRFAEEELGLDVGGSYSTVSDTDGSARIWVVTGARRDRLEGYTWWFPIVGRVPYKGFFAEERAREAARALEAEGYDTWVRSTVAFSTLGWFDDPLLSHLLGRDELSLATVVIHELFHQTVYVPGEAAFNESAASFVGMVGAIEFFCALDPESEACAKAGARWRDAIRVSEFLGDWMGRLSVFYAEAAGVPGFDRRREEMFATLDREFASLDLETGAERDFLPKKLNNASLLHQWLYARDLSRFEALRRRTVRLAGAVAVLREIDGKAFEGLRTLVESGPAATLASREESR